ncbi:shikimate dehydrogenase [Microbacterium sp. NPDC076911]|uniref:shikimate dehydrogenase family protein n=1 Tax=Microbacterium sp. NPDC076911 TaxID=3154958 RepID=UPI003415801E
MTETSFGYMGFVGVSTGSSSIMQVFPRWADVLGLPTRTLVGHDLPMDATPDSYIALLEQIRDDPHHRGALITTHKMNMFAAASDLFDELDPFAVSCAEISSVSKRGDALIGRAKDPITVALALDDFLPEDYFSRSHAEVLILGAGGSGTALSWALAERADRPSRVVVTAPNQESLDHLRQVHRQHRTPDDLIEYVLVDSAQATAAVLADMPQGSLVVNATGLGKDRPGSPLPDDAVFPLDAYVWEFNYRGTLEFLHQARAQADERGLHVVDGWRYFIHGWSQVVADVFDLELTAAIVEQLADAAEFARQ